MPYRSPDKKENTAGAKHKEKKEDNLQRYFSRMVRFGEDVAQMHLGIVEQAFDGPGHCLRPGYGGITANDAAMPVNEELCEVPFDALGAKDPGSSLF